MDILELSALDRDWVFMNGHIEREKNRKERRCFFCAVLLYCWLVSLGVEIIIIKKREKEEEGFFIFRQQKLATVARLDDGCF